MIRLWCAIALSANFALLSAFSGTGAFGQTRPAGDAAANNKLPAVFVVAVKGECQIDRESLAATESSENMTIPVAVRAQKGATSGPVILTRLLADYPVRISVEEEFRNSKNFRIVNSPSQAAFVFYVCSSYWEYWGPKHIIEASSLSPSYRLAAQAYAISPSNYRRRSTSITDRFKASFWEKEAVCTRTIGKKTKDVQRKKKDKAAPAVDPKEKIFPPGEASPKDLARMFIKDSPSLAANLLNPPASASGLATRPRRRPALVVDKFGNPVADPASANIGGPGGVDAGPDETAGEEDTLKIDSRLVIVPVSVSDKDGKYFPGLRQESFKVFEDGVEQQISDFGGMDSPFHVTLMLDVSGSTGMRMAGIQKAAIQFVNQLRPQDRVMIVSFDNLVRVESEFTRDRSALERAILRTQTGTSTRVYDALDLVLNERLKQVQGRKAIVLFSDGVDTSSKFGEIKQIAEEVEESAVLFYSIHYDTWVDNEEYNPDPRAESMPQPLGTAKDEFDFAEKYLRTLSSKSGGRFYEIESIKDSEQAYSNIAEELRRQYWLGYYSSNTVNDGGYRRIRVSVDQPNAVVRARTGYRVAEVTPAQR